MIVNIRLYLLLFIIISLLGTNLTHSASNKKLDTGSGIVIDDDAGLAVSQGLTHIIENGSDVTLRVPGSMDEGWETLLKTMQRLGVPFSLNASSSNISSLGKSSSTEHSIHVLKTNWISWYVDAASGKGVSEPGLLDVLKGKDRERHKFLFRVVPSADNMTTLIQVIDAERQTEIDVTPDSTYSWLEWQKQPSQTAAAYSFLRRIQGVYELAMTSHLIKPGEVTRLDSGLLTRQEAEDVALISVSDIPEAKPVVQVVPTVKVLEAEKLEPKPLEPRAIAPKAKKSAISEAHVPETPKPVQRVPITKPKPKSIPKLTPLVVREEIKVAPKTIRGSKDSEYKKVAPKTISESKGSEYKKLEEQSARGALAAANVLWIQKTNDVTWAALLKTLKKMDISLQMQDVGQRIISTEWLDYFYDKKNQSLRRYSKDKLRWAFNLMGDGKERHRFQLTILSAKSGTQGMQEKGSLIYAFHTGSQELTDLTPDSSQTNLAWEEQETQAGIASAFLRLLSTRLLVK